MVVEEFPFEQLMDGNEVNLPHDGLEWQEEPQEQQQQQEQEP